MKNIQDINMSAVNFSAVRKNPRGGKFINVTLNNEPIRVQLPPLRAPFGVSTPDDNVKDYYLSLSMTPEVEQKMTELDEILVNHVAQNSVELLGKSVTSDVIRDLLLNPIAKSSKDPEKSAKYAKTIKMKVSTNEGKNIAPFFINRDTQASVTDLKAGSTVTTIIEIGQVWFINGKFGASVKLLQGKISPSTALTDYAFADDDEIEIDAPIDD